MANFASALRLLGSRWRSLLGFELLCQFVVVLFSGPLLKAAIDAAMALSGYDYLTWENVFSFVGHPASIAVIVVLAVLLSMVALFELAGIHYLLALDGADARPRVRDALRYAVGRVLRGLRPRNLAVVPYLVVVLPLASLGPSAGFVRSLALPDFVMEYIEMNTLLAVAYLIAFVVLYVFAMRYLFAIVFFAAGDAGFNQAASRARAAGKGHVVRDVVSLFLVSIVALAFAQIVALTVTSPILASGVDVSIWNGAARAAYVFVALMVSMPATYAMCLAILRSRGEEPPAPAPYAAAGPRSRAATAIVAVFVAASVAVSAASVYQNFVEPVHSLRAEGTHPVALTAHRGGTFGAPENTMAAFRQALADGADICELDVQQSADGVVFVSHDSNFKRISGVDQGAWELTWAEVSALDATGSYWAGFEPRQGYPLLDDVIAWADENGMLLNIELKPTGHETRFEESVAAIIDARGFADRCVVTSQAYDSVERMNELVPELTCVYVSTLAYGDICQLDAADAFSIEETSATPTLVSYLHARGKPVYAWVVNSEAAMWRVIANGIDNVITDDVPLAREVLDEANAQPISARLLYSIAAILAS